MKALLIDDETKARATLQMLLEDYCPEISSCTQAISAKEALKKLTAEPPDILFLDIQMPVMDGLEFAQLLGNYNFPIIFVTAYSHYTIQALRASAVDYLLKPVNISELRTAVSRLHRFSEVESIKEEQSESLQVLSHNLQSYASQQKIRLRWDGGFKVIDINQIVKIESQNSYSEVYLVSKEKLVTTMSLSNFESLLSPESFYRVHNRYIINFMHLDLFSIKDGGHVIMRDGSSLPVARRRLQEFRNACDQFFGKITV